MLDYMITVIGIASPEQKAEFEKFAREAISNYEQIKKRCEFLEIIRENYENKEFGKLKK